MLSALFSEADSSFIFANGYKVAGSARGPLQSYPNESKVEEVGKKKEMDCDSMIRSMSF